MSDLKTLLDKMFAVPAMPAVPEATKPAKPVEPETSAIALVLKPARTKKAKKAEPAPRPTLVAVPRTKAKAAVAKKAPTKKRKPKKTRIEELDAVCSHPTLNVPGWLILDYAMVDGVERVVHACFDPVLDEIDNVEITVSGLMRTEKRIALTDADDGSRWSFALVEDAESLVDEDAEDEDIEVDADAADYEVEDDHPFNQ